MFRIPYPELSAEQIFTTTRNPRGLPWRRPFPMILLRGVNGLEITVCGWLGNVSIFLASPKGPSASHALALIITHGIQSQ